MPRAVGDMSAGIRTLLINPPSRRFPGESKHAGPPLGLAYLAAMLEERERPVHILDATAEGYEKTWTLGDGQCFYGLTIPEIVDHVRRHSPDLVGISCIFSTLHSVVLRLCASIRAAFP